MRSLFARMFVAFAVVTVGVTLALSAYYDARLVPRQEQRVALVADAIELHGEEIATLHAAGDDAGARAALAELAHMADLRIGMVPSADAADHVGVLPAGIELMRPEETGTIERRAIGSEETWFAYRPRAAPDLTIVAAMTTVRSSLREIRIVLLIVVTALVSFLLARLLTRPIRTLRAATQKIAEGDTSVRVGRVAGAGEEIAGLAADFDRMTERIEDLLRARERLLRDVSHELRSPLARLQVALGIARQKNGQDVAPLLDRMEKEIERLGELIGLVLSMARLEQARAIAAPEDVRLDELVGALAADASFEVEGSQRSVKIVHTEPVTVRGDGELLRQAAENVVRNAVRFAPTGTLVEIRLDTRLEKVNGKSVELSVRDHGPGVPDEALSEIFRPFTRVEAARDRASGGAGIGLAITERAVRLHEGSVSATNAEGGGLCVTIRLPAI
jgi:signal transduction histidine kinase